MKEQYEIIIKESDNDSLLKQKNLQHAKHPIDMDIYDSILKEMRRREMFNYN